MSSSSSTTKKKIPAWVRRISRQFNRRTRGHVSRYLFSLHYQTRMGRNHSCTHQRLRHHLMGGSLGVVAMLLIAGINTVNPTATSSF